MKRGGAGRVVLTVLLAPLIVGLGLIVFPWVLVFEALSRIEKMRFCRRHRGESYVIASPRRDWHAFVVNNVLPEMPPDASLVWHSGRGPRDAVPDPLIRILQHQRTIGTKPVLVRVSDHGLRVVPLHAQLAPLKHANTKKDEEARRRVHALLRAPHLL